MEIRINSWWFSIWGLFVHDAHIIGPCSEDKIEEWINQKLCRMGYVVVCPKVLGRRSWSLFTTEGESVIKHRLYTSTQAEAEIEKLAPVAHEALVEIDTQTFSV